MSGAHTPAPWRIEPGSLPGAAATIWSPRDGFGPGRVICDMTMAGNAADDARLIAAAPALLAKLRDLAEECGDCAGTRVCPDDSPCKNCADIWAVIDAAEGRA